MVLAATRLSDLIAQFGNPRTSPPITENTPLGTGDIVRIEYAVDQGDIDSVDFSTIRRKIESDRRYKLSSR